MQHPSIYSIFVVTALTLVTFVVGCAEDTPNARIAEYNSTNIQKLRNAYGLFMMAHESRGPDSKEELLDYLTSDRAAAVRLGRMGVALDEINDIFVCERDGKPFKIRYGVSGLESDQAIIFESEGVEGKRMVAFLIPRELDDEEYEKYWTEPVNSGETDQSDGKADETGEESGKSGDDTDQSGNKTDENASSDQNESPSK